MPINIPPYWAKYELREGKESVIANGWSTRSASDALEHARSRARKMLDRVVEMRKLSEEEALRSRQRERSKEYEYATPIREEVVDRLTHDAVEIAVVSRNRYGALVLNSDRVFFADVDFKPFSAGGVFKALALFFSPAKKRALAEAQRQEETARIIAWGEQHRDHPFRLYRTCAGLRLLFTGRAYGPKDPATLDLLGSLGADPMYVNLTRTQSCFRARLSPKPWRIKAGDRPPAVFPFLDENEHDRYRRWLDDYRMKSESYRVCHLVHREEKAIGDPAIRKVVELHDRLCRVDADLPLA